MQTGIASMAAIDGETDILGGEVPIAIAVSRRIEPQGLQCHASILPCCDDIRGIDIRTCDIQRQGFCRFSGFDTANHARHFQIIEADFNAFTFCRLGVVVTAQRDLVITRRQIADIHRDRLPTRIAVAATIAVAKDPRHKVVAVDVDTLTINRDPDFAEFVRFKVIINNHAIAEGDRGFCRRRIHRKVGCEATGHISDVTIILAAQLHNHLVIVHEALRILVTTAAILVQRIIRIAGGRQIEVDLNRL